MNRFAGKVVLVTGAGGSVGQAICRSFAAEGATVLLNCFHSFAGTKAFAAELDAETRVIRASVAKPEHVRRMIDTVGAEFGRLDVLVNNAAYGAFLSLDEVTEPVFDRVLATNVKAPLWCVQAARPLLAAAGGAAVVNVSSIGATHVLDDYLLTGASKAALESLTRALAVELAGERIRVNTASAGLIDNSSARLFHEPDRFAAKIRDSTPLGRLGTPQDLANLVTFLASDQSAYMTGQSVVADGGLLLGPATLPAPAPAALLPSAPSALPTPATAAPEPEGAPDDVVVVGMGIAVPGASSPEEFWRLLNTGAELFTEPAQDRWRTEDFGDPDPAAPDKSYQTRGGFITAFTPHPRLAAEGALEAPGTEPNLLWLRHCLLQALDGTSIGPADRVLAAVGYSSTNNPVLEDSVVLATALEVLRDSESELPAEVATRVGKTLRANLRQGADCSAKTLVAKAFAGLLPPESPIRVVDAACASALTALHVGVQAIRAGRAEVAVCAGSEALTPTENVLFAKLRGLSPTGEVRSLDTGADGVLFGDGAALVVLKTRRRAKADGDHIHGVIAGGGLASDGRGKAVHAPNAEGQRRAIDRALTASGLRPSDVDYVVAHGTGTPIGDSTELDVLAAVHAGAGPTWVGSNKSIVGHPGWGAGLVSVIQLLLALRHETIPPQHRLRTARPTPDLRVPGQPVPWPRGGKARVGAVSAFGFGGANAHVLITDRATARPPAPAVDDPAVVVGWSGLLPGGHSPAGLLTAPDAERSFGPVYPVPPLTEVRLPGPVARATDRTQLMLLQCAHRLDEQVKALCATHSDRVGVLVAHVGLARNSVLHRVRVNQDRITRLVREAEPGGAAEPYLTRLRAHTDRLIAPVSSESGPGAMLNIAAARLNHQLDLHGTAYTVDSGEDSLAAAFELAAEHLDRGELDVVLVGVANGNTLTAWTEQPGATPDPREGAFLFAVTRRSLAGELPATGLAPFRAALAEPVAPGSPVIPGAGNLPGALALLTGALPPLTELAENTRGTEDRPAASTAAPRHDGAALTAHASTVVPGTDTPPASEPSPTAAEIVLRRKDRTPVRPAIPAFPADAILLTNSKSAIPGLTELPIDGPRHIRIVVDLPPVDLTGGVTEPVAELLAVHTRMFALAKESAHRIDSFAVVLLGGVDATGTPHPFTGLFTGFTSALELELAGPPVLTLVHDSHDLTVIAADLAQESTFDRPTGVAYRFAGERWEPVLRPRPTSPGGFQLGPNPVIVAAGGSRGVGAELLTALAERGPCRIYLLGTAPASTEPAPDRTTYLRERTRGANRVSPAEAAREHAALVRAEATGHTLRRLRALCDEDQVHHLTCDIRDAEAVHAAVRRVLAEAGPVDLVLNIAGINDARALAAKSTEMFEAVRDIKVRGYLNLKRAFGTEQPRRWFNCGSVIGHTGQLGETDYAAANAFLQTAAVHGAGEWTLGFGAWRDTGFAAGIADRLTRQGFTPMSTVDGVRHFLAGLDQPNPAPAAILIGPDPAAPFGDLRRAQGSELSETRGFYLREILEQSPDHLLASCPLDAGQDAYLDGHQVRGRATLPGAFVLEMAAEVACALRPGLLIAEFADLELHRFISLPPGRTLVKRIEGRLRGDELTVTVSGDVVAKNGRVLVENRVDASVTVRLTADLPTIRHDRPVIWDGPAATPTASGPLTLTGPFASLHEIRRGEQGAQARFRHTPGPGEFLLPAVLLDAAVQLGLGSGPVTVPRRIARIAVLPISDRAAAGAILSAEPGSVTAVDETGRLLLRMEGLTGAVLAAPEPAPLPETQRLRERIAGWQQQVGWNPCFPVVTRDAEGISSGGRRQVSFSGFNYLGLATDPEITGAATAAIQRYGTSCSASRLVLETPLHQQLQAELADFLGCADALVPAGGFVTNVTAIDTLLSEGDLMIHDAFAHASLKQGGVLSGATVRSFPHNDHAALDRFLTRFRSRYRRALLVLEGIYSMDGDIPDLPAFVEVARRHEVLVMVDEAHSIGVLGATGRGLGEHFGLPRESVDLWAGTLSKALASFGGYVAGRADLIDLLRYGAAGFLFSAGLPPGEAAAAHAALRRLRAEPALAARVRANAVHFGQLTDRAGINTGARLPEAPVVPCMVGDERLTVELVHRLYQQGVMANAVLYPAVPQGQERVRFFVTAEHTEEQITRAVGLLAGHMTELGLLGGTR